MEIRKIPKVLKYEETVYISNDGKPFSTEAACLNHEKKYEHQLSVYIAEKYRIAELNEKVPINCSDMNENNVFAWYRVNDKSEFDIVNNAYRNQLPVPKKYPEIICVEYSGYSEIYTADFYGYFVSDMKALTEEFWKLLGYEVVFSKQNS